MKASEVQWDMASTLEQLGGDEMLLREVMEIFMREAPQHLAALVLAIEEGDAAVVETMAHTMKGELGYLGVPEISRQAREIEEMGHTRNLASAHGLLATFEDNLSGLFRSIQAAAAVIWPAQPQR